MTKCQFCGQSGQNMKTCEACFRWWCAACLNSGKWPAKRTRTANECPYCGKLGKIKSAAAAK